MSRIEYSHRHSMKITMTTSLTGISLKSVAPPLEAPNIVSLPLVMRLLVEAGTVLLLLETPSQPETSLPSILLQTVQKVWARFLYS